MYEKLDSCPSCGNETIVNELICKDTLVSQESFVICRCTKCKLLFTNPRPQEKEISKYYQSEEYISHNSKGISPIKLLYKLARFFSFRYKQKIIASYKYSGVLLDVGCGTGSFLQNFKGKWITEGVESDDGARETAELALNKKIYRSIYEIEEKQKYDVITLWHVLEHLYDLNNVLKHLRKLLKKDGYIVIAVPNHTSQDANYYKNNWAAYDVPRHLYHFSKESFKSLAVSNKLSLVEVIPLYFDAYYISLLSNKNLNEKESLAKALWRGYLSNKEAKHSKNYSSLIYILERK